MCVGSMASKGANKGINDPRLKAYHLLPPDKGVQVCMLRVGRVACRRGWIGGWGLSFHSYVCVISVTQLVFMLNISVCLCADADFSSHA